MFKLCGKPKNELYKIFIYPQTFPPTKGDKLVLWY